MSHSVERPTTQAGSIEPFVVIASPDQAEAAWSLVQEQPVFSDQALREAEVQQRLASALAGAVPGWSDLVVGIAGLLDGPGTALVRGLRFDPENRLAVGLTAAYSRPSNYGHWKNVLVYDLRPIQRPPGTPDFEQFFHTGSQSHDRPHEVQVLQCVRPGDQGGGVSQLVTIDSVVAQLRAEGRGAVVETLMRPYPHKRPAFMGELVLSAPLVETDPQDDARYLVRFQREVVFDGAAAEPGAVDEQMQAAIEAFEAAMLTPGLRLEYQLAANEYLTIDNRRVLHARTPVVGGPASGRYLKRIKAYRP
jgi:alpha-ketoglutarate-dependent taurine dioxygenase